MIPINSQQTVTQCCRIIVNNVLSNPDFIIFFLLYLQLQGWVIYLSLTFLQIIIMNTKKIASMHF